MSSRTWRRDYPLLKQVLGRRRAMHEEMAIQARYDRQKRDWEHEDRQRDWSRTWSCKSKKVHLREVRQRKLGSLALVEAAERENNQSAPIHRDTTAQISKILKGQKQNNPAAFAELQTTGSSRREKRFKFNSAAWAETSAQQKREETEEDEQVEVFELSSVCSDDVREEITESFQISTIPSLADVESSDDDSCYVDEFYLSEEDLPALGSMRPFALFDSMGSEPGEDTSGAQPLEIANGESVDIEDEKTGFLRVEYGPKRLQLLKTERVVPRMLVE